MVEGLSKSGHVAFDGRTLDELSEEELEDRESSCSANNSSGNNNSTANVLASISNLSVEKRVCNFKKEVLMSGC